MTGDNLGKKTADTPFGPVEYSEQGAGKPVLFIHGSPGGCDQGALMAGFLVPHGFRTIALSRPGYLGTPLTDATATPDQQAELAAALMAALGVSRYAVMCWSGGGPSSYRLAAKHGDRVTALVALAALSMKYTFGEGMSRIEYSLMTGALGKWLSKEMVRHTPKTVVGMVASEEGDLSKEQAQALTEHIWNDEAKRDFVLGLSATIAGRKAGLDNDGHQYPLIGDLGLPGIATPTLLVHGTADADVHPDQSENALALLPNAEILRVANGTHVCTWTDPTSADIQARIVEHLKNH